MFQRTLSRFRALRMAVRSLVFLYWIYAFTGTMIGVFTQIFIYQKFSSIELNIFSMMLFYVGIMIGFVVFGYLASLWRINIKHGFLAGFLLMATSVLVLFQSATIEMAFLALFLSGIGEGLFWLTIHTFELAETKNEERDFYSSLLTAGGQVFALAGPATATLLIWLSQYVLHWGTFTLLFTVTPAVYLLGFFCFRYIQEYRPAKIEWSDITHFLSDRKNNVAQIYLMGSSLSGVVGNVVWPLIMLSLLGSTLRVGIYSTLLAVFSALTVVVLAHYRTVHNRLFILGLTTAVLVLITITFGYIFTLWALIVYTILEGILSPIRRVSEHVIDLETMESIGRPASDFYATMLLRDFSLFVWRIIGGFFLLACVGVLSTERETLVAGLYFTAFSLIIAFVGAYLLLKFKKQIA